MRKHKLRVSRSEDGKFQLAGRENWEQRDLSTKSASQ